MDNPVHDLEFWKQRILRAKRDRAHRNHYSVYLINDKQWQYIVDWQSRFLKDIKGSVLDAGCGYGRISEYIDDYTGVDFSPDFIEWAKELYPGKKFIQANLKALPFKDKEFDWAICSSIRGMIIGNLGQEEWDLMEKEISRVAKKILIMEYESPETCLIK